MENFSYWESPLGMLQITDNGEAVVEIAFAESQMNRATQSDLGIQMIDELARYFSGNLTEFSIALNPRGSAFQRKVWDELLKIPYGETRSYGEMAEALGDLKLSRAVGMANGKNPIAIVIPCHRVIGANGSLTGYAGGLDRKKALLQLESKEFLMELF